MSPADTVWIRDKSFPLSLASVGNPQMFLFKLLFWGAILHSPRKLMQRRKVKSLCLAYFLVEPDMLISILSAYQNSTHLQKLPKGPKVQVIDCFPIVFCPQGWGRVGSRCAWCMLFQRFFQMPGSKEVLQKTTGAFLPAPPSHPSDPLSAAPAALHWLQAPLPLSLPS